MVGSSSAASDGCSNRKRIVLRPRLLIVLMRSPVDAKVVRPLGRLDLAPEGLDCVVALKATLVPTTKYRLWSVGRGSLCGPNLFLRFLGLGRPQRQLFWKR